MIETGSIVNVYFSQRALYNLKVISISSDKYFELVDIEIGKHIIVKNFDSIEEVKN